MRVFRILLIVAALALAVVPLPPRAVEQQYSLGLYPLIQERITPLSNLSPVALLDLAVFAAFIVLAVAFRRRLRSRGALGAVTSGVVNVVTLTAVVVLVFFLFWGLNYRRLRLEDKLTYDESRVTRDAAVRLGERALNEVNTLYAQAHEASGSGPTLESAFAAAQQTLGSSRLAVPGVPKRSLLERYFRLAAIDGMTDPFFLEIILNPDALPFERPFVLAHEWAHLAGYANEGEANFVAWLTCSQGDAMARYSAWMAVFEHVVGSVPRADRAGLTSRLAEGPRRDLHDAAARYARSSPAVRSAATGVYDSYLKANRIPEGVASYTEVVRLMLGANLEDGRRPTLR